MNSLHCEFSIFRCPKCRAELTWETERITCQAQHAYPIRFGIPDFRTAPDPYIGIEEEVAKVKRLLGPGGLSFEQLILRYYELTPEVPPALQARYRHGLLAGQSRGAHLLDWVKTHLDVPCAPVLDIGCGTAGLALAAHPRGLQTYGIDVALRWIVIGRQRLIEAGIEPLLFCANAETLPFAAGSFATVVSDSTLEHTSDAAGAVNEATRVCRPGGLVALQTANERSVIDPYTSFPLPGLMPRKIRSRVIARVSRAPYLVTTPARHLLAAVQRQNTFLHVAPYVPAMNHHVEKGGLRRVLASLYGALETSRLGRAILRQWGLFLCVYGRVPLEKTK